MVNRFDYNNESVMEILNNATYTDEQKKELFENKFMSWLLKGLGCIRLDRQGTDINATKEILLSSTEEALFVTELQADMTQALTSAKASKCDVAAAITKKVTPPGASEETESKLVVISSGNFMADFTMKELNQSYPMSYIGSNMDFTINSMAFLAGKDNLLTIRKEYNSSTYTPTNIQNLVVVLVIIFVPILIIATGIIIGAWRKRRK